MDSSGVAGVGRRVGNIEMVMFGVREWEPIANDPRVKVDIFIERIMLN